MANSNEVTILGRPHDIRCPQKGRIDVTDCCKPMVAFTARAEERERCAKVAEKVGADARLAAPESLAATYFNRACKAIADKIRS